MSNTHKQTKKQDKKAAARREKLKQLRARKIVEKKAEREQREQADGDTPKPERGASTSGRPQASSKPAGPPGGRVHRTQGK